MSTTFQPPGWVSNPNRPRYHWRLCPFRQLCQFVVLLGLISCATTPPLAPETRAHLGHVGVVGLPSEPRLEFRTFAKGWAEGTAKGGTVGVVEGLLSVLVDLSRNPPTGPYAGVFVLVGLVVEVGAGAVVYGVQGGLQAVPSDTAREVEQKLRAGLGDVRLSEDLAKRLSSVAATRPDLAAFDVTRVAASGNPPTVAQLADTGLDTLVEIQVTEAGFRGGSRFDPQASFYMNAQLRLLATATGQELYTRDFQFQSRARPFADWFTDGARALSATFDQAITSLADRIADELFVTTHFPFESGILAFPGSTEFGSCWFYPVDPALKYTSLGYSVVHNAPGIHIRYTKANSVEPLLAWEGFPRPRDQKPENEAVLHEISDVTYDLKIWEAPDDYPDRLVYDVSGLDQPRFRPPTPLKPATPYFWTFRARYELGGQPQVTRWAFSNIPSFAPSDYPSRPPAGSCELDAIPSTNYYRFVTP